MIIVKLMGGLGNQMFQYAAARRLALRHGTEVAFDGSYFEACPVGDTVREYALHHFSIAARFATPREIAETSGLCNGIWTKTLLEMRRVTGLTRYSNNLFREPQSGFCPEVLGLPDNVYLAGYWHSERYFADVGATIRQELTVRSALAGRNQELAARLASSESVFMHFRRGDYVESAKTAAFHGVLPLGYYQQALDTLRARVSHPRLFIFTDDPQWVRQHVAFSVPFEVVDHNPPRHGYEDLRLMSLCRHAIIANSSFSWGGAWLMQNPDKIVIAPRQWFAEASMNPTELTPPGWMRID